MRSSIELMLLGITKRPIPVAALHMMVLEMILNGEAGTKAQRAAVIRIAGQVIRTEDLAKRENQALAVLNALRTKEKLPI